MYKKIVSIFIGIIIFVIFITLGLAADKTKHTTGCIVDPIEYKKVPVATKQSTRSYSVVPAAYSLRKYAPTPGSQGSLGSCTAWATAYGGRTIIESLALGINDINTINQNAFSPSYVYNRLHPYYTCNGDGTSITSALNMLRDEGVVRLRDFPYSCSLKIDTNSKKNAYNFRIKGYNRLPESNVIDAIKKSISENKPVIISIPVYTSFDFPTSELWDGNKSGFGGYHALCVVGYDNNKYGGAFEILNSWGTDWGNQGYIWMTYNDFMTTYREAYEVYAEPPSPHELSISGEASLVLSNGNVMPVTLDDNTDHTYQVEGDYQSDTKFRLYLRSHNSAYIYMLGYDTTNEQVKVIYPFDQYNSSYFDYKNSEIAIPDEKYFIRMDKHPGKDYLCIIYSSMELDIKNIADSVQQNSNGSFNERIKSILGDTTENTKFTANSIGFTSTMDSNNGYVVPLVLEFNHL